ESFGKIRAALEEGRFEVVEAPLEGLLEAHPERRYGAFNLSDIFEYMSVENTAALLERIVRASEPGARLAYWNMLAPRSRPEEMVDRLKSLGDEAWALFEEDRAFFYSR